MLVIIAKITRNLTGRFNVTNFENSWRWDFGEEISIFKFIHFERIRPEILSRKVFFENDIKADEESFVHQLRSSILRRKFSWSQKPLW